MISSTAWVRRGLPAEYPAKYQINDEEMERITGMAKMEMDIALDEMHDAAKEDAESEDDDNDMDTDDAETEDAKLTETDDDLKEYNMEDYDKEESHVDAQSMGIFGNFKSLQYYGPEDEDPYITLKDLKEEEEEEHKQLRILPTDNMVLVAKTKDEVSQVEVMVYDNNPDAGGFYVHHDFLLPSFPLCLEPVSFSVESRFKVEGDSGTGNNFVAVSTFEPEIEIWNLDVVDSAFPDAILGGDSDPKSKLMEKKKTKLLSHGKNPNRHTDSVLSLSSNIHHRNFLASGSADETIKIWDLKTLAAVSSLDKIHKNKICAVQWSPHGQNDTVLLSGSFDKNVCVTDVRSSDPSKDKIKVSIGEDIESIQWDLQSEYHFYVGDESGKVGYYDVRQPTKSIWSLQAHDAAPVSVFAASVHIPGLFATGSSDRKIKLWKIPSGGEPSMILSRDLDVGKVFSATFGPDPEVGGTLAVGGSNGLVKLWDTATNKSVRAAFGMTEELHGPSDLIINDPASDGEEDDDDVNW
ncbi:hypothetical protein CANCADRAFT_366 [Tortispora caseinolytica NRRL Y-17796]|uniref:Uncharacterized protein n=1 Tax=Tortispora caseinolytica NRRL Y-17796 TaxID=767744 RepID=A0A1E4TJ33_9ASCO|nr:hypothetical protein CANCADRAFT_366 [Tortispora caseinolytica NRRL Y-17796]